MTGDSNNVVKGRYERNWLIRLADRFWAWRECRTAVKQLSAMSDRMLQDIGIERYEISEAVRRPAGVVRLTPAPEMAEKITKIAKIKQIKEIKQAA